MTRLVTASAFAVMIAVSVWVLVGPSHGKAADCTTAQAMWTYYQAQMISQRTAALNTDNSQTEAAYRKTDEKLQSFANRISTPEIRTNADDIVAVNRAMFEQWKSWATATGVSDDEFGREFARNARKLETAHAGLESDCR